MTIMPGNVCLLMNNEEILEQFDTWRAIFGKQQLITHFKSLQGRKTAVQKMINESIIK